MDIIFKLIKDCCSSHLSCKNCPLSNSKELEYGKCVLTSYPAGWDLEEIENSVSKLLEENKFVEMFYEGITNKLLKVMNVKGEDRK